MKQIPSHSQTPSFVKNESCTTPVLYQPPTQQEQRPSRIAQAKADLKDACIFLIIAVIICMALQAVFGGVS